MRSAASSMRRLPARSTTSTAPIAAGANLFGDCLLALDARTGKRLWHFQMVHHDIWDYDDATAPKLLTVRHEGKSVDVVAQVSKQGFVWVFNRVTGEPLWPIEERPVPQSEMPGEETWPTQPFPVKPPPFARQKFTVDDLSPFLTPEDRARFRDEILSARNEGLFTPPGQRNTIQMPGNNGGANWGGAAVDPTNGTLVGGLQRSSGDAQVGERSGGRQGSRGVGGGALLHGIRLHDCERRTVSDCAAVVLFDCV